MVGMMAEEDQMSTGESGADADEQLDNAAVVELLNGIPGAAERLRLARDEIARGDGLPLSEI